ncbi:ligase-associated DNA damage response exonuclease [Nisaea acidiphila]|uniref:Ligase-associated DNA damage response exonuclease n=1 Tax=Nisaea acidiphila TaxID=1862145 RepID=A0A9J7AWF1_9PROT|nr:ligase-associated DNA damage response exonuclease [Nisaea acidiphila]UUX49765.1 ligase-associated DNA damage response exonuclease [Nisaea acidiphila]
MTKAARRASWIRVRPEGLLVEPGGFYVDPTRAVERAVITHGHADHARPGHGTVAATAATLAIMRTRYGEMPFGSGQPLALGETITINGVKVWLAPAGHVLGSAQVVLEYKGERVVVSGDYKRRPDRTCTAFEPVPCDVFVTEATFGLPVFRHPPDEGEMAMLMHSRSLFPDRCHVIGTYSLGKAQRLISLIRAAGYDKPLYLHGALMPLCELYQAHGVDLGELLPATAGEKGKPRADLSGEIVLAPPSAIADRWARRLPDPVVAMASGWMRVKQRAKQGGVELPLVISDHADWDELLQTLDDVGAPEVWVTHGREEALVHAARKKGIEAKALRLLGYEEEG